MNLFPTQIEELILGIPALAPHFQCLLDRQGPLDTLTVHVEHRTGVDGRRGGRGRRDAERPGQDLHRRDGLGAGHRAGHRRAVGGQDVPHRRPADLPAEPQPSVGTATR